MTIGIYFLRFKNTDKVYIGQSVNIERRFITHKSMLKHGKGRKKLQEAYYRFGEPILHIHLECTIAELNIMEELAIKSNNSYVDGFNATPGGDQSNCYGIYNAQAKYTEDQYYNVLALLATPGISWKSISKATGVSEYVVSHISALESHGWLEEAFPEEYKNLKNIHDNVGRRSAFMQGIIYPKIVSPSGEVFEVHHVTNFAKDHGLLQPKLHEVLTGSRPTHKGWHLESYERKPDYPAIKSPDGKVFLVEYGKAAAFCREHDLTKTNFSKLLAGKANSHKGWTLA